MDSLPKNNLADVLKRKANGSLTSAQTYSPSPRSNSGRPKFKPAISTPSTNARTKTPHNLPSFSTPGFRQTKPQPLQTNALRSPHNTERIHLSDPSTPSTPNPLKRASSDPSFVSDPSPQLPKRSKNMTLGLEKENILLKEPAIKPKENSSTFMSRLVDRAAASSISGPSRESGSSYPPWMETHLDLLELSSDSLGNFRNQHHKLLTFVMQILLDGMDSKEAVDIKILRPFRKELEERLEAIKWVEAQKQERRSTDLLNLHSQDRIQAPDSDDELWAAFDATSGTPAPPVTTYLDRLYIPSDELREKLKDIFGLTEFRPNQLEAITATMEGKDVFVLMPTGGGKSLCYQLPAVCTTGKTCGVTIVVSPLTALMEDQVSALVSKGIDAFFWSADSSQQEVNAKLWSGDKKPSLLYLTPEKLKASPACRHLLSKLYNQGQLARFAIDEAHCISTWGQDFRNAYQGLGQLREDYPDVPIIALTATANQRTREDIVNQLQLRNHALFTQSFNRPNLKYVVKAKKNVLDDIVDFINKEHHNHSGVIYCLSRKSCEKVAAQLKEKDMAADYFHAGLNKEDKNRLLENWKADKFRIIVATIAFGMGIDKADVRFVIHYDLPKSLSGYYQETGRAGRDGKPADCVLYYCYKDFKKICWMIENNNDCEEPLTPEAIERQKDAAREVLKYCTNISECRRVQVLRHFGQDFSQCDCQCGCDNCLDDRQLCTKDVTIVANSAIDIVQRLSDMMDRITLPQLTNVLRGTRVNELRKRGLDEIAGFETCKNLSIEVVELALDRLLVLDILTISMRQTNSGYSAEYVEIGSAASSFKTKEECLQIEWRPPPEKGASRPTRQGRQTKGKRHTRSSPQNEDPIESFPDEETSSNLLQSSITELYARLDDLRHQISVKENLPNKAAVMSEALLQSLCYDCPRDYIKFDKIVKEAADEYSPPFKKYRNDILQICIQHQLGTTHKMPSLSIGDMHDRFGYHTASTSRLP